MECLELVPIADLLDELTRRFEHVVFAGLITTEPAKGAMTIHRHWAGNSHSCMGLCADLQQVVFAHFMKEATPLHD